MGGTAGRGGAFQVPAAASEMVLREPDAQEREQEASVSEESKEGSSSCCRHIAGLYGRTLQRCQPSLPGPNMQLLTLLKTEAATEGRCQNLATVINRSLQVLCGEQTLDRAGWNQLSQEGQTQGPNDSCRLEKEGPGHLLVDRKRR